MADYPIASPLSQKVLELRRLNAERGLEPFDSRGLLCEPAHVPIRREVDEAELDVAVGEGFRGVRAHVD